MFLLPRTVRLLSSTVETKRRIRFRRRLKIDRKTLPALRVIHWRKTQKKRKSKLQLNKVMARKTGTTRSEAPAIKAVEIDDISVEDGTLVRVIPVNGKN